MSTPILSIKECLKETLKRKETKKGRDLELKDEKHDKQNMC